MKSASIFTCNVEFLVATAPCQRVSRSVQVLLLPVTVVDPRAFLPCKTPDKDQKDQIGSEANQRHLGDISRCLTRIPNTSAGTVEVGAPLPRATSRFQRHVSQILGKATSSISSLLRSPRPLLL